jgi:hypothetical protein
VPELKRLQKELPELAESYAQLETRVGRLLDRYNDYVGLLCLILHYVKLTLCVNGRS